MQEIRDFFVFPHLFVLWPTAESTFARKRKEKRVFLLLFPRLFVPLHQISEIW